MWAEAYSHDGQRVTLKLEEVRRARVGTDFRSGGLHDYAGITDSGYRLTAKGSHQTDPKKLIECIRSEIEHETGRSPSIMPPAYVSGVIESFFEATIPSQTDFLQSICAAIHHVDLLGPQDTDRVREVSAPISAPTPTNASGNYPRHSKREFESDGRYHFKRAGRGLQDYENRKRKRIRIRPIYVYLVIVIGFFIAGLYIVPSLNVIEQAFISLFNSLILLVLIYGIAGIANRSVGRKIFAVALILIIAGFLYQNPSVVTGVSVKPVRGLIQAEASLIASLGTVNNGVPSGGANAQSTSTAQIATSVVVTQPTSSVTPTTNSGGAEVDSTWAEQFVASINEARLAAGESPLQESTSLDQFAKVRFNTMVANYQLSHYGFDKDESCFFFNCIPTSELGGSYYYLDTTALNSVLNQGAYYQLPSGFSGSYWPLTLGCPSCASQTVYFTTESAITSYLTATYGKYVQVTFNSDGSFMVSFPSFGEVVFFPSGFSPDSYASYVQNSAPLHWQVLMDPSLKSFGFYVGLGPTYEITNGCGSTEIPGPNINESQFFSQNGCQYTIQNGVWLVVDLGSIG